MAIAGAGHLARRRRPGLALSFIIGYPIFGTICFLVGLVKVNAAVMGLVTIVFGLAGIFAVYEWLQRGDGRGESGEDRGESGERRAERAEDLSALRALPSPLSPLPSPLSLPAALVLILGFVAAQAPPSSLDEL